MSPTTPRALWSLGPATTAGAVLLVVLLAALGASAPAAVIAVAAVFALNWEALRRARLGRERDDLVERVRERTAELARTVEDLRTEAAHRRAAEADREREREFLRAILENVGDGIVACDELGVLTLFNRAARKLHDLPAEPLPPDRWSERYGLYAEDGRTPLAVSEIPLFRAWRGERVRNVRMAVAPRGGKPRVIVCSGQPLVDGRGGPLGAVACMTDITELVRSIDALRHAERKYRGIFEQAADGIFQTTPDGRYLEANPAMARMYGYATTDELIRSVDDIAREVYVDPARRADFVRLMAEGGRVEGFESQVRRRDGPPIWISENARAVRDAAGELLYYEGFQRDVSERKNLEEQVRQSQKMDAVGQLAGGIAHDFNNLLTIINGYSEMLLDQAPHGHPWRGPLEEVAKAGGRAAALTGQLLAFSRKQVVRPEVLDPNAIVADIEKMLKRLIGEDVILASALDPNVGRVRADRGQFEQVLMNLAVNARDAMPGGGRLTVETRNVEVDGAFARDHFGARPGPHVLVAVSDTGCGMTAEVRAHLFEPFFTTKERGKGTGLGLATAYGIVRQAGGTIGVYSEPGLGTTFKVYLPRADGEPGRAADPAARVAPRGTESVLLVEDEEGVREFARAALEERGYAVRAAANPEEALGMAGRDGERIDLLVTDVVMPGMSGRVMAERMAAARPGLRVLYVSGYTDDAVVRHGVLGSAAPFIQKPFGAGSLACKVREVLDAGA